LLSGVLLTLLRLNWNSIVDILLVALIFYWLLILIQGTQAVNLLRGILFLVVAIFTATSFFDLTAFRWLINNSLPALLVAIPVIFQPELRRALERLGRTGGLFARPTPGRQLEDTLKIVACTAQELANQGLGALVVLERETGLESYVETGTRLDALVSEALLLTIFYTKTALHDGAVIIRDDRIVSASSLLPLSRLGTGSYHLGTRHRASLGLTEATDAIVVVVSEETGVISVAYDGRLIRNLDETRLLKLLKAFYRTWLTDTPSSWFKVKRRFNRSEKQV
jgi:diadenylate cyclase